MRTTIPRTSRRPSPIELSELLELNEQKEAIQTGQTYPQVGVRGFGQGLFAKEAVDGSQTTYKTFNRLYEGSLVLSQVKGWEGAIAVCPPALIDRYVSPEYRTFRCISGKLLPEYMSALVATPWFWRQLKSLTRGVGARRERTRPEQFLRMRISMPSLKRQEQALSMFKDLENMKRFQAETATELDALLPSVLDRAFKGEL
jgi:type I restriction enzyme, S subunit